MHPQHKILISVGSRWLNCEGLNRTSLKNQLVALAGLYEDPKWTVARRTARFTIRSLGHDLGHSVTVQINEFDARLSGSLSRLLNGICVSVGITIQSDEGPHQHRPLQGAERLRYLNSVLTTQFLRIFQTPMEMRNRSLRSWGRLRPHLERQSRRQKKRKCSPWFHKRDSTSAAPSSVAR